MAGVGSDIQKLAPSALIELYTLDLTPLGGLLYRFHANTNELKQSVVWQGYTYTPFPIKATGFDVSGKGILPRPKLVGANVAGALSALCVAYDDMVGAKLTRKRTFSRYLDAVNFTGGVNAIADSTAAFPDDVFYVEQKVKEDNVSIEWELASVLDFEGVQLPRRQIIANTCAWQYRSAECSYAGSNYFTSSDAPTANPLLDVCSKRLAGCQARFGTNGVLPYGGFPGALRY
jgi:lambda family phage minor tail protein L